MSELVFVVSPEQNAFFIELAELLAAEARAAGGQARLSYEGFDDPPADGAFVMLPPHEYKTLEPDRWPGRAVQARTIFITAEQPHGSHFRQNALIAAGGGALFDLNRLAIREYRRLGLQFRHLPLGYSPHWDRFDPGAERDIDLLFMGCATDRRLSALAGAASACAGADVRLLISDNSAPNTASSAGFVSGEEKFDLLSRSRVLLNIHREAEPYFEWVRVLEAIHCGTAIASEVSVDFEPLRTGKDFLAAPFEEVAVRALDLARDEERRERMAETAYARIRETMPVRRSAELLLESAAALASAPPPVRIKARVWAAGARLSEGSVHRARTLGSRLLRSREPGRPGRQLGPALKDLRLDLMEIARKGRTLELSHLGTVERLVTVADNRPPRALPRVSVISAVYNHAGYVADALDSVSRSGFGDWELVVCDDGSTDGSGSVVAGWMEDHPQRASALLAHPVNRGLPAARNACLEAARGQYVLVLDADNELYPRCLERLAAALDADPDAGFAYGILEQFSREGPFGLSGYYDWDPQRLADENYIDALAMVRADVLRGLGGYARDRRLYGWEDYDLWCRLAEAGSHGVHVPEIVARYRLEPGSMISLTNLSVGEARDAIAERSPNLFEQAALAAATQ